MRRSPTKATHDEKMHRQRPPDILIRPKVEARVLEFMKARQIIDAAEPVREEVKRLVDQALALKA